MRITKICISCLIFVVLIGCGKSPKEEYIINEIIKIEEHERIILESDPELLDLNGEAPGTVLKYYFHALHNNQFRAALKLTSSDKLSSWEYSDWNMKKHADNYREKYGLLDYIEVLGQKTRDNDIAIVKIKLPTLNESERPIIGDYELRKEKGFWKVKGWLREYDEKDRWISNIEIDLINNRDDLNKVKDIASQDLNKMLSSRGITFKQYAGQFFEDYYRSQTKYSVQDGNDAYIMLSILCNDKDNNREILIKATKENNEWKLARIESVQ